MKKALILLAVAATIISSCQDGPKREQLISSNDSLMAVIASRDAALEEMINTINRVEAGFREINEAQGRINLDATGSEISFNENIEQDFAYINETLQKNKEEIEKLKTQLSKNQGAYKQLHAMLENLQKQLADKGKEIEAMRDELMKRDIRIASLDKTVEELTQTNEESKQTIDIQEAEINTVWYAIGTKKELKNENILKSGDVLRATNANLGYFTKADMRELTTINTYAKSAKLLTTHPENSYSLEKDSNKQYILTIKDAVAFWSISKYLVIQVR
ncbi:MAG: hypothetical protein IIV57_01925 [Bacteroidaceae bacterium]|nr:hypothetical protein [Bacteroidaceae bacterium]